VLLKSDGMPTYNFANVVDDHLMNITHIMRGTEYLSSTPKYNLLYEGFGWAPPVYIHMQPIMRDAAHKLSKREGDATYDDLLREGYLPDAVLNYIALLGWSPKDTREKFSLSELITLFSIEGLSKSPSIFDRAKLRWLNAQYIKELPPDAFYALALPWLQKIPGKFDNKKIARLVQPRIEVLSDIPVIIRYLYEFADFDPKLYEHQKMKTDAALAKTVLPEVLAALEPITAKQWNEQTVHDALLALPAKLNLKNGQILFPARVAITATETTPGGAAENADILGREETLKRLKRSIERLQ
jgi:glutamyl-tRNA synthetase